MTAVRRRRLSSSPFTFFSSLSSSTFLSNISRLISDDRISPITLLLVSIHSILMIANMIKNKIKNVHHIN